MCGSWYGKSTTVMQTHTYYRRAKTGRIIRSSVIVDRGASYRAGGLTPGAHPWTRPFVELSAPESWFAPVRSNMAEFFGLDAAAGGSKVEVTYLSTQMEGPAIRKEDYDALVRGLGKLGAKVHVVNELTPWKERVAAILRSSVSPRRLLDGRADTQRLGGFHR